MRRLSSYIIVVLFCCSQGLKAQTNKGGKNPATVQPFSVKATVDKQKIVIGQPIQLMLEATAFNNSPLSWPSLDSLPHFDWLQKGGVDSTIQSGGRYYRQYLTLTSWDSGSWAIPRLTFTLGNKKFQTDSVRVEVAYTKIDPNKDFHDIKDIIEIPNPFSRWFGWIVALVALVCLALVVWLVMKKKKILKVLAAGIGVVKLSPYEDAVRQLEQLKKQGLVENGNAKEFYSSLGDILRTFLLKRLNIASLAETSEELITQLRKLPLATEQFDSLADTLRMSDFVKFAKYQPSLTDSDGHWQSIRSALDPLDKIGQERDAAAAAAAAKAAADKAAADRAKAASAKAAASKSTGAAAPAKPAVSATAKSADNAAAPAKPAASDTAAKPDPDDATENPNASNKTQQ